MYHSVLLFHGIVLWLSFDTMKAIEPFKSPVAHFVPFTITSTDPALSQAVWLLHTFFAQEEANISLGLSRKTFEDFGSFITDSTFCLNWRGQSVNNVKGNSRYLLPELYKQIRKLCCKTDIFLKWKTLGVETLNMSDFLKDRDCVLCEVGNEFNIHFVRTSVFK